MVSKFTINAIYESFQSPPVATGPVDTVPSCFQTSKTTIGDDSGGMTVAGAMANAGEGGGAGAADHQLLTAASSATLLAQMTGRRQKLPVPKTETEGINLWNLGRRGARGISECLPVAESYGLNINITDWSIWSRDTLLLTMK